MNATTDNTVAVMVEPVQGEGGVNIPDADYFQRCAPGGTRTTSC